MACLESINSHWIYTMYRCALLAASALCIAAAPATAQMMTRHFPADAMRGEIVFGAPPEISLNGEPSRLAPGARIRGQNNMMEMSAPLAGQKHTVHYTVDMLGQPKDIWLLRPQELARRPWPATPRQLQEWQFDPMAQTWTRR